jgi:hypothetical protein
MVRRSYNVSNISKQQVVFMGNRDRIKERKELQKRFQGLYNVNLKVRKAPLIALKMQEKKKISDYQAGANQFNTLNNK